jgi:hypothetical protein
MIYVQENSPLNTTTNTLCYAVYPGGYKEMSSILLTNSALEFRVQMWGRGEGLRGLNLLAGSLKVFLEGSGVLNR